MADTGSGHWYTSEGEARHWQEDGKKTTLRHARKQNLYPSVSGILGVVANEGLMKWKIDNHIKLAMANRPLMHEDEKAYVRRMRKLANTEQGKTLDFGTNIHASIEKINDYLLDEQNGLIQKTED